MKLRRIIGWCYANPMFFCFLPVLTSVCWIAARDEYLGRYPTCVNALSAVLTMALFLGFAGIVSLLQKHERGWLDLRRQVLDQAAGLRESTIAARMRLKRQLIQMGKDNGIDVYFKEDER